MKMSPIYSERSFVKCSLLKKTLSKCSAFHIKLTKHKKTQESFQKEFYQNILSLTLHLPKSLNLNKKKNYLIKSTVYYLYISNGLT